MANTHISAAWTLCARTPLCEYDTALQALFNETFSVIPVMRPEDLEEVYKLRYEVYCLERGFEDPACFSQKQEVDMYDERSVYTLLQHNKSGEFIGTARLILPDRGRAGDAFYDHFPAQTLSKHSMVYDRDVFPHNRSAEISRICYSQKKSTALGINGFEQRLILPGILSGVFMLCDLHNIDYLMAVLEKRLIDRCDKIGFSPCEIGDAIEHRGTRYLVAYDRFKCADAVKNKNMDLWNIITAQGKYAHTSETLTIEAMVPQWDMGRGLA